VKYTVVQGDCLSSIASRFGFSDWRVLYDHPSNAELRTKRPNPNLICPGDQLFVPEKERNVVRVATGQVHHFVVRRPATQLRLRLQGLDDTPMAGVGYTLRCGHLELKGTTTSEGIVEQNVPAEATLAELVFDDHGVTKQLQIGALDPLDTVTGMQARLLNLGYDCGPIDGIVGPRTRAAVRSFQTANPPLVVDGIYGSRTRAVLLDKYGC
jgi:Putative peptidoglycan binding domain/LysM domain